MTSARGGPRVIAGVVTPGFRDYCGPYGSLLFPEVRQMPRRTDAQQRAHLSTLLDQAFGPEQPTEGGRHGRTASGAGTAHE